MRVLALDLGEKRIGVAISDPAGKIAYPLTTIQAQSSKDAAKKLQEIIDDYDVSQVIVGLPVNLQNKETTQTLKTAEHIKEIQENISIEMKTVDERLSTREAEKLLLMNDIPRKKRKEIKDQLAASLFLQNYLSLKSIK